MLESVAAMTLQVGRKVDGRSDAVKVWLQIRASQKGLGDGRNFLKRYGDEVWYGSGVGERIEQRRRERLRIDELPRTVEAEEVYIEHGGIAVAVPFSS
jgi:hypothetical protein